MSQDDDPKVQPSGIKPGSKQEVQEIPVDDLYRLTREDGERSDPESIFIPDGPLPLMADPVIPQIPNDENKS